MIEKKGKIAKPELFGPKGAAVPTSEREGGSPALGARLELAREKLGMKQEEFAAAMGVALGTYHRYRRGDSFPRVPELARIAELGIDMNWLITGSGEVMKPDRDAAPMTAELQSHTHVLPMTGSFVIDEQLIVEAVVAIEAWLSERNLILPPETKGKVVALLVEDAMSHGNEERAARIRSQTGLMLRLVS